MSTATTTTTPGQRAPAPRSGAEPAPSARWIALAFARSNTDRVTDIGLLIARVITGAVFIGHGGQKLFGWWGGGGIEGTGASFEKVGLSPGEPLAILAGSGEFFGGILLILGLLTRLGAFAIATSMVIAIISMHLPGPFLDGYEYPLTLLGISILLLLAGPGRYGLDAVVRRRLDRSHHHAADSPGTAPAS